MRKTKIRRIGKEVPPEVAFWFHDGRMANSLKKLLEEVIHSSDETFSYHVNKEKNDFVNWINNVLDEKDLGKKTRPI
jgi:50S ribosomal subunit-associated GTPase HflX